MMRGFITERDFEKVEATFPGIVNYYRQLQEKPATFLDLLWGFMQQECGCSEPVPVASRHASRVVAP